MVARSELVSAPVRASSSAWSTLLPAAMSSVTPSRATLRICRSVRAGLVRRRASIMRSMDSSSTAMRLTPASVRIHSACSTEEVS